jgi:hypothetical protein
MPTPRLFGLRRTASQQGSGVLDIPVDDRDVQSSSRGGTPRGSTPRLTSQGSSGLPRRESSNSEPSPSRGLVLDEVRPCPSNYAQAHLLTGVTGAMPQISSVQGLSVSLGCSKSLWQHRCLTERLECRSHGWRSRCPRGIPGACSRDCCRLGAAADVWKRGIS